MLIKIYKRKERERVKEKRMGEREGIKKREEKVKMENLRRRKERRGREGQREGENSTWHSV